VTARNTWKATERKIAAVLGGRRIPVTGRARGDTPDVAHPWLAVEVKHWAQLPARVTAAMRQAEAAAHPGQLPIAVIHGAGERIQRALVVMRLGEFVEWFGDGLDEHEL
jgi:hypothetical protein